MLLTVSEMAALPPIRFLSPEDTAMVTGVWLEQASGLFRDCREDGFLYNAVTVPLSSRLQAAVLVDEEELGCIVVCLRDMDGAVAVLSVENQWDEWHPQQIAYLDMNRNRALLVHASELAVAHAMTCMAAHTTEQEPLAGDAMSLFKADGAMNEDGPGSPLRRMSM